MTDTEPLNPTSSDEEEHLSDEETTGLDQDVELEKIVPHASSESDMNLLQVTDLQQDDSTMALTTTETTSQVIHTKRSLIIPLAKLSGPVV